MYKAVIGGHGHYSLIGLAGQVSGRSSGPRHHHVTTDHRLADDIINNDHRPQVKEHHRLRSIKINRITKDSQDLSR